MQDKVCPNCKTKLSDFYRTSMLGCPNCYRAFSMEIMPELTKIHGKTMHEGKLPKTGGVEHELLFEYKRLLAEKEELILRGKFSESVKVGKMIKELEEALSERGLK